MKKRKLQDEQRGERNVRPKSTVEKAFTADAVRAAAGVVMAAPGSDAIYVADTALAADRDGWCVAGKLIESAWMSADFKDDRRLQFTVWAAGMLLSRTSAEQVRQGFLKHIPRFNKVEEDRLLDIELQHLDEVPNDELKRLSAVNASTVCRALIRKVEPDQVFNAKGFAREIHEKIRDTSMRLLMMADWNGGLMELLLPPEGTPERAKWKKETAEMLAAELDGDPESPAVCLAYLLFSFTFGPEMITPAARKAIRECVAETFLAVRGFPPGGGVSNDFDDPPDTEFLFDSSEVATLRARRVVERLLGKNAERQWSHTRFNDAAALYAYVTFLNLCSPKEARRAEKKKGPEEAQREQKKQDAKEPEQQESGELFYRTTSAPEGEAYLLVSRSSDLELATSRGEVHPNQQAANEVPEAETHTMSDAATGEKGTFTVVPHGVDCLLPDMKRLEIAGPAPNVDLEEEQALDAIVSAAADLEEEQELAAIVRAAPNLDARRKQPPLEISRYRSILDTPLRHQLLPGDENEDSDGPEEEVKRGMTIDLTADDSDEEGSNRPPDDEGSNRPIDIASDEKDTFVAPPVGIKAMRMLMETLGELMPLKEAGDGEVVLIAASRLLAMLTSDQKVRPEIDMCIVPAQTSAEQILQRVGEFQKLAAAISPVCRKISHNDVGVALRGMNDSKDAAEDNDPSLEWLEGLIINGEDTTSPPESWIRRVARNKSLRFARNAYLALLVAWEYVNHDVFSADVSRASLLKTLRKPEEDDDDPRSTAFLRVITTNSLISPSTTNDLDASWNAIERTRERGGQNKQTRLLWKVVRAASFLMRLDPARVVEQRPMTMHGVSFPEGLQLQLCVNDDLSAAFRDAPSWIYDLNVCKKEDPLKLGRAAVAAFWNYHVFVPRLVGGATHSLAEGLPQTTKLGIPMRKLQDLNQNETNVVPGLPDSIHRRCISSYLRNHFYGGPGSGLRDESLLKFRSVLAHLTTMQGKPVDLSGAFTPKFQDIRLHGDRDFFLTPLPLLYLLHAPGPDIPYGPPTVQLRVVDLTPVFVLSSPDSNGRLLRLASSAAAAAPGQ
jgi:hypothetical protein